MAVIGIVIHYALMLYLGVLIARMLLSYVPLFNPGWQPRGPMLVVAEAVYTLTDPPLKALGRVIPPVRLGSVMLDVGFMLLWFLVLIAMNVNRRVFLY